MFAMFIVACGTTHIFGVIAIWRPYYRLDGVVKLLTGAISILTAILLWPLVNKALLLPSPAHLRLVNEQLAAEVIERQRAEEDARRANEDLDRRVQERTAQLRAAAEQRAELLNSERAARAEAERASRIKDDFVATLSHELRTPISAILGWTKLLRDNPDRPDAAYGLEVVERNTRAQARLIEDLLDVSRIVSGKLRLDVQSVDIGEIISAALETVRPAAEAKGVRLQAALDPKVGFVRGDGSRLQQVVWNLLSNSIKFTPKGGSVKVSLQRINSHIEIVVEDSGCGISPDFLPYVFDRFRQGDASITRTQRGLGLGLSIVRHLVELHGGTVAAQSAGESRGATFTVALPLSALSDGPDHPQRRHPTAPPAPRIAPTRLSTTALAGITVLIVDDEPDTRDLLLRVLSDAGATVLTAGSASEGIRLLAEEAPRVQILISDIGMPEEDGYTFVRRVRQLPDGRGAASRLPAIAMTAFARSEDRTRAMMAGFQAHIAKPADADEVIATVASLLGRIVSE
jgi:signal transduction histidine kinase/ActR/RegA family two-component response regulator